MLKILEFFDFPLGTICVYLEILSFLTETLAKEDLLSWNIFILVKMEHWKNISKIILFGKIAADCGWMWSLWYWPGSLWTDPGGEEDHPEEPG